MEWQDKGIIIGLQPYGETSLIIELMTQAHGRHRGIVRGGRSRQQLALYQAGNIVDAHWRARLSEHLGQFRLEVTQFTAAKLMQRAFSLYALQIITEDLRLLPERDPSPALYELVLLLFKYCDKPLVAGEIFTRFELRLLEELGFGLDLTSCAVTGKKGIPVKPANTGAETDKADELIYVSPKSGRAVSRIGGAPWKEKLLFLPQFLHSSEIRAKSFSEVAAAFHLAGFFLSRNVWEPRGLKHLSFRDAFFHSLESELGERKKNPEIS